MIQKPFRFDESDLEIIGNVRIQQGFGSEAEALRYIVRNYHKEQRREDGTILTILKDLECNQSLLLDAVNTILIQNGIEVCQPLCLRESPVFTKSKEYKKDRLAHLKEKKDYQNRKKGDKFVP